MARTTLSIQPATIVQLGLPAPEREVQLPVCHGCYISIVSGIMRKLGIPKAPPIKVDPHEAPKTP